MIILTNVFIVVGTAISLIKDQLLVCLYVGRFIYGLAGGAFAVYVPTYLAEMAPLEVRGPITGLSSLMCVTGQ